MFYRYREYLVVLERLTKIDNDEKLFTELKVVKVMARSKKDANYKALIQTPGIWTVRKKLTS